MGSPPFKVKAVFEYKSPHEDDLSFPNGQIITVTDEEDADWYVGEYVNEAGEQQNGLFPKNFVERYEPAAPPRPSRSRPKREAAPVEESASQGSTAVPEDDVTPVEPRQRQLNTAPATASESVTTAPQPQQVSTDPVHEQKTESPKAATASKAPPPAVASKPASNAFKDRIAAFNKPSEAPVAPIKPGGLTGPNSQSFVKKPFVAPPPSKNAYVPPLRDSGAAKVYRREEDPEIAERRAQDQENAAQAGLAGNDEQGEAEEAPKATSLKDRIALLQKQQQEQAARRAEAGSKEKPKRPTKPRAESSSQSIERAEAEDTGLGQVTSQGSARRSMEEPPGTAKPSNARNVSQDSAEEPARSEVISDGNEADQSGAGETTEDAEGTSTEVDDSDEKHKSVAPKAPARTSTQTSREAGPAEQTKVPPAERIPAETQRDNDEEEEEEEEETEEDREARRKAELRQRMAKMSGGMGMAGMFGPTGSMSAASASKKKGDPGAAAQSGIQPSSPPVPPQRAPMVPVPGMPHSKAAISNQEVSVEREAETGGLPAVTERTPGEVPDVEDLEPQPSQINRNSGAPPIPKDRPARTPSLISQPGPPPPVPGERPAPPPPESRPAPPPPPRTSTMPTEEYDSSDEAIVEEPKSLPMRPQAEGPRSPTTSASKRASHPVPPPPSSPPTSADKRASRPPPPIPVGSSTSTPSEARAPPPPPPTAVHPARQSMSRDSLGFLEQRNAAESDYEGDYDTDIAPSAPHKEALKSKPSFDEGTLSETPTSPAPPPPPAHRTVPPPPTQQPSVPKRSSVDLPRAPPPVPPPRAQGDEEYDPFHYSNTPPVVSPKIRDPGQPQQESDTSFYAESPRQIDRAPLPPPQSPPTQKHAAPPPLPPQHSAPSSSEVASSQPREVPRQSVDMPSRASTNLSRRSMEASRTLGDQGFMARDVDLAESSQWWTVPNHLPPAFQGRTDILSETEESSTNKRGGHSIISKDVYILFTDYSQTVITAQFDPKVPNQHVLLEQRHEPPPPRPRQDQLEAAHARFGQPIAAATAQRVNSTVAEGHPLSLVIDVIRTAASGALLPVGPRAYGAIVYANLANASVQQHDEMRPGDIITFRNAKFSGKHGAMHAKYAQDVGRPDHVAVVAEWDGTKKKVRVWEQGRSDKEGKEASKEAKKVKLEGFRLGDLRSGEVRVWRVMGREYVGWEGNS